MGDEEFYSKLKSNYIELEKFHKFQMKNCGLFMQAVTDICDPPTV